MAEKKPGRDQFKPFSPEVARLMASAVYRTYQAESENRGTGGAYACVACNHPDRLEIDYQLLMKMPMERLSRTFKIYRTGAKEKLRHHRDNHVLAVVKGYQSDAEQYLIALPFPMDGTDEERARWYLMQAYGIRQLALQKGDHTLALRSLREMQMIDREMLMPAKAAALSPKEAIDGPLNGLLPAPAKRPAMMAEFEELDGD